MSDAVSGFFITFEGGEGVGKTTQVKHLKQAFESKGYDVLATREPGGFDSAERIRELLVTGKVDGLLSKTELLLHTAARYEHVERVVKPHLQKGGVVLCDRFLDSTYAYQVYGHGIEFDVASSLYRMFFGDFKPDMTLMLMLPPEKGLKRAVTRDGEHTRYEAMGQEFHQRVEHGFRELAARFNERIALINADQTIEQVHEVILSRVSEKLSLQLL